MVGKHPPPARALLTSAPSALAVPLLASIQEDILALLLREATQQSELLIAEMSAVLQIYLNVSSDIFTIAKCSQKVSLLLLQAGLGPTQLTDGHVCNHPHPQEPPGCRLPRTPPCQARPSRNMR